MLPCLTGGGRRSIRGRVRRRTQPAGLSGELLIRGGQRLHDEVNCAAPRSFDIVYVLNRLSVTRKDFQPSLPPGVAGSRTVSPTCTSGRNHAQRTGNSGARVERKWGAKISRAYQASMPLVAGVATSVSPLTNQGGIRFRLTVACDVGERRWPPSCGRLDGDSAGVRRCGEQPSARHCDGLATPFGSVTSKRLTITRLCTGLRPVSPAESARGACCGSPTMP